MVGLIARLAVAVDCTPTADIAAPFIESAGSGGQPTIVLEVRAAGADPAWIAAIAAQLERRGERAVFAFTPAEAALGRDLAVAGHEIALVIPPPADATPEAAKPLARERRAAAKALGAPIESVVTTLSGRTAEAVLGLAGYQVLLAEGGPPDAAPRVSARYATQSAAAGLVLPIGPWRGECADPVIAPFLPDGADRATAAIRAGAAGQLVRVGLDGGRPGPDDAKVLGRWLDEVVRPAGATLSTASEARAQWTLDPGAPVAGRPVSAADAKAAATALSGVTMVPRSLPGELRPTEAFMAFLLFLDDPDAEIVTLRPIAGPRADAPGAIEGTVAVPRATVVGVARALLAHLPAAVPASMPVGEHLLGADELLLALGGALLGEDPVRVVPMASPDPMIDGLGWGSSD